MVSFVGNQQAREVAQLQQALGMPRGLERPDRDALASLTPDAVNRRDPRRPTAKVAQPAAATVGIDARAGDGDAAAANRGAIKWFDAKKGFGFIERPDGNDLFVHFSSIEGGLGNRLAEGQLVDYEVGPGRKGPEAQNVRLLATAAS